MSALIAEVSRRREEWQGTPYLATGQTSGTSELVAFLLEDLLPDWDGMPLFLYLMGRDSLGENGKQFSAQD